MKLLVFDPESKPKETEIATYQDAEKILHKTRFGDSAWAILNDDGIVLHSGIAETFIAREYMEKKEQEFFCEKCRLESSVEYTDGDDVHFVIDLIASTHAMQQYNCALKFGSSFVRVRSEGCSEEEWGKVTGKVKA
ncbi:MAG: hypothetical protein LAO08_06505 [Acidobacteriia bacterium]|nr:hypothetical protein [Terriglobia bacterium]